ncbi:MAG: NADH-quinone oxidoreductase subunit C [Deltaproteobacteria bacterium]|nr:NADH-quinone oxidoreductase subunit C [Deltaproteobacteria bacterium]
MNQEAIRDKLISTFGPEAVQVAVMFRDQLSVTVAKDKVRDICRFLRDDPDMAFNFLSFVAAVDRYPETPRFEVVYQLQSLKHNHRFRIKAMVEEPEEGLPTVDSVVEIWPSADWDERETAEMFGMQFKDHPDPRKLFLPEYWTVHPLRKDFPLEGTEQDTPDLPRRPKSKETSE